MAKIRFGLVGLDWADLPLRDLFATTAQFGATCLEVFYRDNCQPGDGGKVRALAEEFGIMVEVVSSRAKLNTDPAEGIPWVRETIRHAVTAGARACAFMIGGNPSLSYRQAMKAVVENLEPLLDEADRVGIELRVENVFSRVPEDITATADGCLELCELLEGRLRLHFDPCNAMIAGEEAFPYSWRLLRPYIGSIHLKDAVRYRSDLYPELGTERLMVDHIRGAFISVPLGRGAMNLAGFLPELKDFDGPVLIELFCSPRERDRYWSQSRAWLKQQGIWT